MPLTIELRNFRNLTSDTDIHNFTGAYPEGVEFSEKTLIFQLPKINVAIGSLVSLTCFIYFQKAPVEFPVTGKILFRDMNQTGDSMRLGVELRQYDKEIWNQFLKTSSNAQTHVDQVFAAIKGESRG